MEKSIIITDIKTYVLGFAMNLKGDHVVLVHKNRPEWQSGYINGVGGKVEDSDANYHTAMVREFREETGLFTVAVDWDHFATMHFNSDVLGGEAMVFCFRMFNDDIYQVKTVETEKIEIFELPNAQWKGFKDLAGKKLISHLNTLIPMARNKEFKFGDFKMQ